MALIIISCLSCPNRKEVFLLPQPQQRLTTIEEYEALPNDIRAEIFDGQIQYMASPSQLHQTILLELSSMLNSYVKERKGSCKVLPAPFDVKLNDVPLTIVQPDIIIVCDKDKLDGKRCNGAPDFIIEIVSPGNASDDYIKKLYYYKNYGVREYWIVDPNRRTISVNYFEEDIVSIPYTFGSTVKVNIYEDLYIDFKEIEQLINS
ncbi:MAG TPA: Uma2 family endonuclease [Clostridiales bacterium]|nr:Uma2 family endonuclease [Clostridiales bacterium]